MPDQILGDRYEVEQQLGEKSGRRTLLAQDLQTQTPVILKLIVRDAEVLSSDLTLFQHEIEVLKTLNHPATSHYFGSFEIELPEEGKAFVLVRSYVEGTSLFQYLQQGIRQTEAEAQQLGKAVLEILCDLHQHQPPIIHRGINPGNILLASPPQTMIDRVSLVDFGLIKSLSPYDETTASMVGTDGYTPPEQMGRRAVQASDLYSLGITLITAMTSIDPVELPRNGMRIDIAKVLSGHPKFLEWLQNMTAPELSDRFPAAEAALAAL